MAQIVKAHVPQCSLLEGILKAGLDVVVSLPLLVAAAEPLSKLPGFIVQRSGIPAETYHSTGKDYRGFQGVGQQITFPAEQTQGQQTGGIDPGGFIPCGVMQKGRSDREKRFSFFSSQSLNTSLS